MRDPDNETELSGVEAAINAGVELAAIEPRIKEVHGVPVALVPPNMSFKVLKEALDVGDERQAVPRRLKGTSRHSELDSFIAHVNQFKSETSVIFADNAKVTLTAVFNYHRKGAPAWNDHRAVYECPLSEQWTRWKGKDKTWMKQDDFGDFIELNIDDLANATPEMKAAGKDYPQPAEVLQMARHLVVNTKGNQERKFNPTTGECTLVNRVENETASSTRIPRAFLLGIPVFDAGAHYPLEALVRLKVGEGGAQLQYILYQPTLIQRDAFKEVREKVQEATGLPLYAGSPEA